MPVDPEIEAMSNISSALAELDEDVRSRVLEWAAKRYGVGVVGPARPTTGSVGDDRGSDEENGDAEPSAMSRLPVSYDSFADLYDAADPSSEGDRALVAAFWWQVLQEEGSFTGYKVNESLRNMGLPLANVTKTMTRAQNQQPALVRQMAKSGKAKQARKTYKLTNAGAKAVKAMLGE